MTQLVPQQCGSSRYHKNMNLKPLLCIKWRIGFQIITNISQQEELRRPLKISEYHQPYLSISWGKPRYSRKSLVNTIITWNSNSRIGNWSSDYYYWNFVLRLYHHPHDWRVTSGKSSINITSPQRVCLSKKTMSPQSRGGGQAFRKDSWDIKPKSTDLMKIIMSMSDEDLRPIEDFRELFIGITVCPEGEGNSGIQE